MARGEDVLRFTESGNRGTVPEDGTVPDPVQVFVAAARLGMYPRKLESPRESTAGRSLYPRRKGRQEPCVTVLIDPEKTTANQLIVPCHLK